MKAIETNYRGYRFRSRLEARWAIFFDACGARWQYEPEGFVLDDGTYYLPDFYLPDCDTWIEVKGVMTEEDRKKIEQFQRQLLAEETYQRSKLIVVGDIPPETPDVRDWVYKLAYSTDWDFYSTGYDFPYIPCICPKCKKLGFEFDGRGARVCGTKHCEDDKSYTYDSPIILDAYKAARMARFEHGEKGWSES